MDMPIEDFEFEERPFVLPGGHEFFQAVMSNPGFTALKTKGSEETLVVSRVGALRGLFSASLRAAESEKQLVNSDELAYLMGWPEFTNADPLIKQLRIWGEPYGLISRSADDSLMALPLAKFMRDVWLSSHKMNISRLKDSCKDAEQSILSQANLSRPASLVETIAKEMTRMDPDRGRIILWRLGLDGAPVLTLAELGRKVGISRERVRQIEARLLQKAMVHVGLWCRLLLLDFMHNGGTRAVSKSDPRVVGWRFLENLLGIPVGELAKEDLCVLGVKTKSLEKAGWKKWCFSEVFAGAAYVRLQEWSGGLSWADNVYLRERFREARIRTASELDKIYIALEDINCEAHYSDIAVVRNRLFPAEVQTDRNVHAALGRMSDKVAYVGRKGMYGLKKFGAIRPESNLDELVKSVLSRKYALLGVPLPYEVVLAEVRRERPGADENSISWQLNAYAIKNKDGRYIPKSGSAGAAQRVIRFASKIARPTENKE